MNELLGKKLYFTKNNEIVFYQDHRWWSEIPHDVEFTITGVELDKYWLTGDGYGNLEKPSSYGNGRILVDENDVKKALGNYHG